jgi:transcription elongation GreA/GreB family factor
MIQGAHMIKREIIQLIIGKLNAELELFFNAARTAHNASIDDENQPDNKYDTLALESSYVAQGQANRAQELRQSIDMYKRCEFHSDSDIIRLASLVSLENENGDLKRIFIGPVEGGLRIATETGDVMVITPASPLGQALIGKSTGDSVEIRTGGADIEYRIDSVL